VAPIDIGAARSTMSLRALIAHAPSPARHGGCKKAATAAPLALSHN
jgi:hypothetical protein